ncbi:MAG: COG4223 family protein [Xanthobacteraceae bacterium]
MELEMVGEEPPSENATPRRRRAPATIDLPASEVSSTTTEQSAAPHADASGSPSPEGETLSSEEKPPPRDRSWKSIAAALAGALAVLVVGGAAWLFDQNQNVDAGTAALDTRIAKIESAIGRNAQPTNISTVTDELASRVAKLEAAPASQNPPTDPALSGRVSELDTAVRKLSDTVSKLGSPNDDIAAALREIHAHVDATEQAISDLRVTVSRLRDVASDSAELDRANKRIAALEATTKSVEQRIEPQGSARDNIVRHALLTTALRDKVASGAPFSAELAAVKALGGEAPPAALESFAAQGVPTASALCTEVIPQIGKLEVASEAPPADATMMDRLKAKASHLIRIRPVGEAAGDEPATIVSRIEAKAARADLDGVLADMQHLPPTMLTSLGDWIAKAKSRQAAFTAAQTYAANALVALAQPPQQQ